MRFSIICIKDILECLKSDFSLKDTKVESLSKYKTEELLYYVKLLKYSKILVDENDFENINILTKKGNELLIAIKNIIKI